MKSKIKKVSSIVLSLSILTFMSVAIAETGRQNVSGSGATQVNPMNGLFEGSATLTIGGGEPVTAKLTAMLLGDPVPSDEGVLHANVSHTFDFGNGNTFTTNDKAILDPIDGSGLYTMNEKLIIAEGTGDFESTIGDLTIHGQIYLGPMALPWASFDIRGAISR
ncbi:MAG: hypothetical protein GWN67_01510 [Phycisphaerae bacterium]|nr:hypothetical protein [Phycisphaerae bacterium]NIP53150.1 hypothetical protein [Phycisphaerae bacterium]NIS50904.1 hypothetical protein [Phycisphaerae bacterium]NIU07523.1 hypothetical protein [Phycisphaerae bacterium]NIU55113.1 hypothetical protein [Phycisphaerae bacterium]